MLLRWRARVARLAVMSWFRNYFTVISQLFMCGFVVSRGCSRGVSPVALLRWCRWPRRRAGSGGRGRAVIRLRHSSEADPVRLSRDVALCGARVAALGCFGSCRCIDGVSPGLSVGGQFDPSLLSEAIAQLRLACALEVPQPCVANWNSAECLTRPAR